MVVERRRGAAVANDRTASSAGLAVGSGSRAARIWVRVALLLGVLVSLFPFYWLVVMASVTTQDILGYPPRLVPGTQLLHNMGEVIERVDFFASLFNTLVVAVTGTVLVLFFDSLAAFAFAKYEFPAKKFLFGALLATYHDPAQLSLVPQFVTMAEFGWAGSLKALIIPGAANAFGIFWMRQYAQNSLPDELLDAGRIDGAGFFRLYWQVAMPLFRPGAGVPRHLHVHRHLERLHLAAGRHGQPRQAHAPGRPRQPQRGLQHRLRRGDGWCVDECRPAHRGVPDRGAAFSQGSCRRSHEDVTGGRAVGLLVGDERAGRPLLGAPRAFVLDRWVTATGLPASPCRGPCGT
jgi:cellobiose transport system permease protein